MYGIIRCLANLLLPFCQVVMLQQNVLAVVLFLFFHDKSVRSEPSEASSPEAKVKS
jgi:hypothetical protein